MNANDQLTKEQLMEFSILFGPPPILSTEDPEHYNAIWNGLIECFQPRDFMETLLIQQVLSETWRYLRYSRHQAVGINRRFRQSLKFQIQRQKELKARKEVFARQLAEKTGGPVTDFERVMHLEGIVESSVSEVDDILARTPTELQHNQALQDGIEFPEQLDRLAGSALARRNSALEQLEFYREGLGQYWRRISDEIIDVQPTEIGEPTRQIEGPPIVPTPGDQNPGAAAFPAEGATPEGQIPPQGGNPNQESA